MFITLGKRFLISCKGIFNFLLYRLKKEYCYAFQTRKCYLKSEDQDSCTKYLIQNLIHDSENGYHLCASCNETLYIFGFPNGFTVKNKIIQGLESLNCNDIYAFNDNNGRFHSGCIITVEPLQFQSDINTRILNQEKTVKILVNVDRIEVFLAYSFNNQTRQGKLDNLLVWELTGLKVSFIGFGCIDKICNISSRIAITIWSRILRNLVEHLLEYSMAKQIMKRKFPVQAFNSSGSDEGALNSSGSDEGALNSSGSDEGALNSSGSDEGALNSSGSDEGALNLAGSDVSALNSSGSNEGTQHPLESDEDKLHQSESYEGTLHRKHYEGILHPHNKDEKTVHPHKRNEGELHQSENDKSTLHPSESDEGTLHPSESDDGTLHPSESDDGTLHPSAGDVRIMQNTKNDLLMTENVDPFEDVVDPSEKNKDLKKNVDTGNNEFKISERDNVDLDDDINNSKRAEKDKESNQETEGVVNMQGDKSGSNRKRKRKNGRRR